LDVLLIQSPEGSVHVCKDHHPVGLVLIPDLFVMQAEKPLFQPEV